MHVSPYIIMTFSESQVGLAFVMQRRSSVVYLSTSDIGRIRTYEIATSRIPTALCVVSHGGFLAMALSDRSQGRTRTARAMPLSDLERGEESTGGVVGIDRSIVLWGRAGSNFPILYRW